MKRKGTEEEKNSNKKKKDSIDYERLSKFTNHIVLEDDKTLFLNMNFVIQGKKFKVLKFNINEQKSIEEFHLTKNEVQIEILLYGGNYTDNVSGKTDIYIR
jgi:hypothetical protein